ncbi:MAG: hypothetical protein EBV02_06035 [Actinobacteria bacterium]|nr:hypothetical protein [Actinomycetota bacterium]
MSPTWQLRPAAHSVEVRPPAGITGRGGFGGSTAPFGANALTYAKRIGLAVNDEPLCTLLFLKVLLPARPLTMPLASVNWVPSLNS